MKTLFFTETSVQLLNAQGRILWSSDADQSFRDEFGDEVLDEDEDSEMVIDYLIDEGKLEDDEEIEIRARYLEDFDDDDGDDWDDDDGDDGDDVLEAEFSRVN